MTTTSGEAGAGPVLVAIELRRGGELIEGVIRVGQGEVRPFQGWLELTTLLDAAARGGRMTASDGR